MTASLFTAAPAAIQEAQAVRGEAGEHISEQGREHQSETGAQQSGVSNTPPEEEFEVWCSTFLWSLFPGSQTLGCFSTQEECQAFSEASFIEEVIVPCQPFDEIPASALCISVINPETGSAVVVPCEELS